MAYESVDKLQMILARKVFGHTKNAKKASGRALGTLVEIITYYLLKAWKFDDAISIEKSIPEYGNPDITHNVEYSLHPVVQKNVIPVEKSSTSLTAHQILNALKNERSLNHFIKKNQNLISGNNVLRNACIIAHGPGSHLVAHIDDLGRNKYKVAVFEQLNNPYAIFECKRVGIEEGNKKGPQTIEKAKQGAYVARIVSSLQRVRLENGEIFGVIFEKNNLKISKPYSELLNDIIHTDNPDLLKNFVLTVGIVSNHGNWFTSDDHSKELKVLAQSYDWLLFLTDLGLAEFINDLILNPRQSQKAAQNAFLSSYKENKKINQFTKVKMNVDADKVLQQYFSKNLSKIQKWFNIISPINFKLYDLKKQLKKLSDKKWENIQ